MGDRGNIAVIDKRREGNTLSVGYTFLYTHWAGSSVGEVVKEALAKRWRWDDPAYLTRILFDMLTANDRDGETGFGISAFMGDNGHLILLLDPDKRLVQAHKEEVLEQAAIEHCEPRELAVGTWTFEEFVLLENPDDKVAGLWNLAHGYPEEGE